MNGRLWSKTTAKKLFAEECLVLFLTLKDKMLVLIFVFLA